VRAALEEDRQVQVRIAPEDAVEFALLALELVGFEGPRRTRARLQATSLFRPDVVVNVSGAPAPARHR